MYVSVGLLLLLVGNKFLGKVFFRHCSMTMIKKILTCHVSGISGFHVVIIDIYFSDWLECDEF